MTYRDATGAVIAVAYFAGMMAVTQFNGVLIEKPILRPCSSEEWRNGVTRAMSQGSFIQYETRSK
jgi:hypothetical protein